MNDTKANPTALDARTLIGGFVIARNGAAIREFATSAGMSRERLRELLNEILAEQEAVGTEIRLGLRYDIHTARYSRLAEFIQRLLSDV
ncbi:hypothetical protein HQ560_08350 [bacterium]|nr:hypothetical protein [bacterium]